MLAQLLKLGGIKQRGAQRGFVGKITALQCAEEITLCRLQPCGLCLLLLLDLRVLAVQAVRGALRLLPGL